MNKKNPLAVFSDQSKKKVLNSHTAALSMTTKAQAIHVHAEVHVCASEVMQLEVQAVLDAQYEEPKRKPSKQRS